VAEDRLQAALTDETDKTNSGKLARVEEQRDAAHRNLKALRERVLVLSREREQAIAVHDKTNRELGIVSKQREAAMAAVRSLQRQRDNAVKEKNDAVKQKKGATAELVKLRGLVRDAKKQPDRAEVNRLKWELDAKTRALNETRVLHSRSQERLRELEKTKKDAENQLRQQRAELEEARSEVRRLRAAGSQPAPATVPPKLAQYRAGFVRTRSGNGWLYAPKLDGWQVPLWVGKRGGQTTACVFSPGRYDESGRWEQVQDDPLLEAAHHDESGAFAWLLQLETTGVVRQHVRRAIRDFETADDDIPF